MKQTILGICLSIPTLFFAQEMETVEVSKNMNNIEWGTESHVIPCSEFSISLPLRDLMKDPSEVISKNKKMKEYPDKRDMPVQTFVYNLKDDGSAYGNDHSMVQTEFGLNNGKPTTKALEQNFAGQSPNVNFRPYDPTGAAGPNHYIQAINGDTYRIWNKTGGVMASGNISALFPSGNGDGDPIILYDKAADRWFMSQFSGSGANTIYIAISQTEDPLGAWYTYEFQSPDFPDYLKFSAWQDGYYMTANYSQKIFAFNRDKMLAGDASAEAVFQTFNPPTFGGFFVPLPADASDGVLPGAGTPCPIFSYTDNAWGGGNVDGVNIYNATVNWSGTPNLNVATAISLPTNAFNSSYNGSWNDIPQQGTSQKLDGIGGAMMFRAQWKTWAGYNTVLLNWNVQVSSTQRGIYWCELRQNQSTNTWSIYQQGIYAPGTESFWLGSIAMNDAGDIGLSYAKSGASTFMSLGYAGRHASDPLGTLPIAEVIAQVGGGAQTGGNRVGDYAQTCLDPDGETFWYTGEYIGAGGSPKTRIYSYKFTSPCTPPTTQATSYSSSAIGDNQMTVSWSNGNGNRRIVLAHESAVVDANPGTGNAYTANAVFGNGDQIGTGNYVVYDGTGTTVTITGLTEGTDYHYSIFEYNSTTNCYATPALTGTSTTTGAAPCTVCGDVASTDNDATGLLEVVFNTISNTSVGDPAYTDFTSVSTDVNVNQAYNLSVLVNTVGAYTTHTKAWIDWNQNCDFTDAGEEYDLGQANDVASGAPDLSPVSITVPAGASLGNTVMRIRTTWKGSAGTILPISCGDQDYSEAEDYTINVVNTNVPPTADFSPNVTTTCQNGSINFTDNSTGTPTSWSWNFGDGTPVSTAQNPSHTFTSSGTFTVSLTSTNAFGNDVSTSTVTIVANITSAQSFDICPGSSVTVGTSTYTSAGTFTDVLQTANGCDSTITSVVSMLVATTSSQNIDICQGSSTTVGTSTYTTAGTYTDVINNAAGCDSTITTVLTVNALPTVSATPTNIGFVCTYADPITLIGNPSGGTFSGNGVTGTTFNPATAGVGTQTITFSYTDGNGCTNTTTITAEVDACAGIAEEALEGVALFPSPNDGHFVITGLEEGTEYRIYDEKGRLVLKAIVDTDPTKVTLPVVETGMYYLQSTKNGEMGRIKFLIAK